MKRAWWYYVPHLVVGGVALLLLYRLRGVLAPFAIAYLLAALLDPLADRLQARGMRRSAAVFYIFVVFLLLFLILLFTLLPIAVAQISKLASEVPNYVASVRHVIENQEELLGGLGLPQYLRDALAQHAGELYTVVSRRVGAWAQALLGSIGFLIWLIIIPVATFYLLNDIDRVRARILALVPGTHRATAQAVACDVAGVFLSYLRGLITVSILFGLVMLLVLLAIRMPYAVALAIMAGVLYPVPYLGPILTVITVALVGTASVGWVRGVWGGVAALAANQVFDQLITPRMVGKSVGLHPVVSMMALLTGAEVFGLVGMVIAVPVAGALQVVAMRLLPWLRGEAPPEPALEPEPTATEGSVE